MKRGRKKQKLCRWRGQEWHQVGEDTGWSSRERGPWRGDKRKRKGIWDNKSHTGVDSKGSQKE